MYVIYYGISTSLLYYKCVWKTGVQEYFVIGLSYKLSMYLQNKYYIQLWTIWSWWDVCSFMKSSSILSFCDWNEKSMKKAYITYIMYGILFIIVF